VTLWFDVINSPSLRPEQKELLWRRLKTRIGKDGVLRVISQQTRSQAANRELAVERFVEFDAGCGEEGTYKESRAVRLRMLEEKTQRSVLKSERSKRVPVED